MNKVQCLKKVLTDLRSLNVLRTNSISTRYFSTNKDSEGEIKVTTSAESVVEKKAQAETKENAETSGFNARLSGFAQSFERFSHIDDKTPETPQTFASLIRNSKFVDVSIFCLMFYSYIYFVYALNM